MLKNIIGTIVLPIFFFVASQTGAFSSEVEVYNMTDTPLVDLQITVSGLDEPSWSGNLLSEGPLLQGDSIRVDTANDAGDCFFNVLASYSDEGTELISDWDFCNESFLVFTGAVKDGGETEESKEETPVLDEPEDGIITTEMCTLEHAAQGYDCAEDLAAVCEDDPSQSLVDCDELWQVYTKP